jgi:hypothetical protein
MIRRLLFPEEMSVEQVAGHIESLVQDKKLIRYSAEGKDCLYLKNFHKHQKLDNPSKPETPLPDWIVFKPYKSKDSQGTYTVLQDVLDKYLKTPYESLTNPLPEPSQSLTSPYQPEHEPEFNITGIQPTSPSSSEKKERVLVVGVEEDESSLVDPIEETRKILGIQESDYWKEKSAFKKLLRKYGQEDYLIALVTLDHYKDSVENPVGYIISVIENLRTGTTPKARSPDPEEEFEDTGDEKKGLDDFFIPKLPRRYEDCKTLEEQTRWIDHYEPR